MDSDMELPYARVTNNQELQAWKERAQLLFEGSIWEQRDPIRI